VAKATCRFVVFISRHLDSFSKAFEKTLPSSNQQVRSVKIGDTDLCNLTKPPLQNPQGSSSERRGPCIPAFIVSRNHDQKSQLLVLPSEPPLHRPILPHFVACHPMIAIEAPQTQGLRLSGSVVPMLAFLLPT